MKFNREQYDEIVLTLENEGAFYRAYMAASTYGARRQVIGSWLGYSGSSFSAPKTSLPAWSKNSDIEDRDQIRRYFDDRYGRDQNQVNTYAHIPSVWGEPKAEPETIVEFKFTGTQAQADGQLAMYQQFAQMTNEACGMPPETYTHPNAPGMLYRKGADGFVEYAPIGGTWADCAKMTNNRLNEANGYVPSLTPTLEETTMNKPIAITTKTFVGETDIATLADSTIYTMIAAEEAAIRELEKIETKPKMLVAEIEKRRTGILALVAHLDAKV